MARDRHQRGMVALEENKRIKKWKGYYYVYLREPDGSETRARRGVTLGLRSEMKKWEAQKKLQEIIDKEANSAKVTPSPTCTMRWFWEKRYRPLKEPTWKVSSAPKKWCISLIAISWLHSLRFLLTRSQSFRTAKTFERSRR